MFATTLDAHIGATLAQMIETGFGPCAAKKAAPYADASHRTIEKAIQVRSELGAWKLLRMVRHPGFRAILRSYIDYIDQQEADVLLRMAVHSEKCCGAVADLDRARAELSRGRADLAWADASDGGSPLEGASQIDRRRVVG